MSGLRPEQSPRGPIGLALVALLFVVVLSLVIAATFRYIHVDEVELPDYRGMPYADAAASMRNLNLVPVSYPDNVPGAPVESVTAQTPPSGAVVRRGRSIAVGVNRPPEASRAPLLLGLTTEQATNTARAVNLALESVEYRHGDGPAGRVIEQSPEPGERVPAGAGLTVVVSRGPVQPSVPMPDLVGRPLQQARQSLRELGVRTVESVAAGVTFDSPGVVTAQEPNAGEEVSMSTPVVLSYNLSAREVVPVPDLIGVSAEQAGQMLRAAGLALGELRYVEEAELPRGSVVEISPSGYTLRGTPVALSVNATSGAFDELQREFAEETLADLEADPELSVDRGEGSDDLPEFDDEEGGRRITVTFDPANLGVRSLLERDYDLRLIVQDEEGERTLLDRRVRAGESISAVVVVHGDALLQTYINDIFFQAWRP